VVDDKRVCPFFVFQRSLVEFLAALINYKSAMETQVPFIAGCTTQTLRKRIRSFLVSEYPELLTCWTKLVKKGHDTFYWTGPDFALDDQCGGDDDQGDVDEIEGWNIYNLSDVDAPPAEIAGEPTEPLDGPSSSKVTVPLEESSKKGTK